MRKTLYILKEIFVWAFVALAVAMTIFTFISTRTFGHANRDILGYKAFIVLSDSMSATDFNSGDLILIKYVDPSTLKPGDIISFISHDPDIYGETVTHKIREATTTSDGEPGFITYGTTTDTNDQWIVTYPYILGKHQVTLPKVGTFFQHLKTPMGYVAFILIPFLALILFQAINCVRLFRQYQKEKEEEIENEREELRKEREESKRVLAELNALKQQQLAQNQAPPETVISSEIPDPVSQQV